MNLIQVLVLSVVEGLTEFLPISSTGHLILTSSLFQVAQTEFVKSFEIFIQLGAIMAVVGMYWQKVIKTKKLWVPIIAAFLPTAVIGLLAYPYIKGYLLGNTSVVLWSLFLGGIVLLFIDKILPQKQGGLTSLSVKSAILIGLFQSISMVPGVSRAAATIIGGLLVGLDREAAVEFSFLLAVPTMAAATGLDLVKSSISFSSNQWLMLGIGFVISMITAWVAIKFLLDYVKKHNFLWFGVYRIVVAMIGYWLV